MSVYGQDLIRGDSQIQVTAGYDEKFTVHIVPIPALPLVTQDTAILCILDEIGVLIDIKETLGDVKFSVSATAARIPNHIIPDNTNCAILSGILLNSNQITVTVPGIKPSIIPHAPSGVAISLELLAPSMVHAGEYFPFIVHELDPTGIPVSSV